MKFNPVCVNWTSIHQNRTRHPLNCIGYWNVNIFLLWHTKRYWMDKFSMISCYDFDSPIWIHTSIYYNFSNISLLDLIRNTSLLDRFWTTTHIVMRDPKSQQLIKMFTLHEQNRQMWELALNFWHFKIFFNSYIRLNNVRL